MKKFEKKEPRKKYREKIDGKKSNMEREINIDIDVDVENLGFKILENQRE